MSSESSAVVFTLSEEWLAAFDGAYTDEVRARVRRYARQRLPMLWRVGARDDDDARALETAAAADTMLGIVAWDPQSKTLLQHLLDVVRYRTRHAYRRALRVPHVSLDEGGLVTREVERELHAQIGDAEPVDPADALTELRALAANDADVLGMLDAYARDITKRSDVMRALGLSSKAYNTIRERLRRYALRVPNLGRERSASDA